MEVAFGVISVTIQLADSLKRLIDLLESVQQAPDDFETLLTDLRLLFKLLDKNERHSKYADENMRDALSFLLKKVVAFMTLVNRYEPGLHSNTQRSRKWSAVKVAFRSKTFEKLRVSIMNIKMTLMLA